MSFLCVGYYPDWTEIPITSLKISPFTHLCHAFALVSTIKAIGTPDNAPLFCATCKKQHIEPYLSLGGAESGEAFAALTRDATRRKAMTLQILHIIHTNGYTGLDIDWEAPRNTEEGHLLTLFVKEMKTALGTQFPLTMAVPATNWSGQWFDAQALLSHIARLHVMTYDNAGEWSKTADHNAPLAFYQSGYDYWVNQKKWPKERLLLGLPTYGRGFLASHWGESIKGKAKHPYISHLDILRLEKKGWKRTFDEKAQNPYLVSPNADEIISFDDVALIEKKVNWAHSQKTGGIFFWEATLDFDGKQHLLIKNAS